MVWDRKEQLYDEVGLGDFQSLLFPAFMTLEHFFLISCCKYEGTSHERGASNTWNEQVMSAPQENVTTL